MNKKTTEARIVRGKAIYDSQRGAFGPADALLLEDGVIREIGTWGALHGRYPVLPAQDLTSCYLLPGLINTHVHFEFDTSDVPRLTYIKEDDGLRLVRAVENAWKMLYSGCTTARDAGSSWAMLGMLDVAEQDIVPLPRLQLAGPALTVTGGHLNFLGEEEDSAEELIRAVRLHQKRRCGAIKIIVTGGQMTPGSGPERTSYTIEQIRTVTDEAHHQGLPTFAHCLTTQGLINTVAGGVQSIEHAACFVRNQENGLLQRVWEPDVMEQFRGDGRYYNGTLTALYHMLDGYREGALPSTAQEEFLLEQEQNMIDIFCHMRELGFTPVLGTDAGVARTYFEETWLELALLVERCGLTPAQAIEIATVNAAECLGLGHVTGRLDAGYAADIIAVGENPLENIRALAKVEQVLRAGRNVREVCAGEGR